MELEFELKMEMEMEMEYGFRKWIKKISFFEFSKKTTDLHNERQQHWYDHQSHEQAIRVEK